MKTCTTCRLDFPATTEFFARRGDGLRGQCRPCHSAANRDWRERNSERLLAYYRERHIANRPTQIQRMSDRYHANRESYRERERIWRAKNPHLELARQRRRRARVAAAEGSYTSDEWAELLERYGHRCLACGAGERITPDHVIPLSLGGSDFITNIQPLCVSCNSVKGQNNTDYR